MTVALTSKQDIHQAIHKFPEMAPFMIPYFRELQEFIRRHQFPAKAIIFRDGVGKDRKDFCDYANASMQTLKIMHPLYPRPLRFLPYDRDNRNRLETADYDFLVDDGALRVAYSDPMIFFVYVMKSGSSFAIFKQMVNRATRRYREEDPSVPKKYPVFSDPGYDQVAHIYYFQPMEKYVDQIQLPKYASLTEYYRQVDQQRQRLIEQKLEEQRLEAKQLAEQHEHSKTKDNFSDLNDLAQCALSILDQVPNATSLQSQAESYHQSQPDTDQPQPQENLQQDMELVATPSTSEVDPATEGANATKRQRINR